MCESYSLTHKQLQPTGGDMPLHLHEITNYTQEFNLAPDGQHSTVPI